MALIDFGGVKEEVITRKEFSMAKARRVLKKETIAVIGYGVQGPAQGLNMRDNGFNVIIGQSSKFKKDWDRAVKDGWVPGKTLFEIDEAVRRGTIIQMLVSDAAQKAIWPEVKKHLKPGDALYFSRAPIPYARDHFARETGGETLPADMPAFRHIGLYAYRARFLRTYSRLTASPLEALEALEQLRALWHGYRISVALVDAAPAPGVDTPEDAERMRKLFDRAGNNG